MQTDNMIHFNGQFPEQTDNNDNNIQISIPPMHHMVVTSDAPVNGRIRVQ